MRKVIGIGETIVDIIFKNDQPVSAKPGGSAFNTLVSVGRLDVPCAFISEVGNDHLGSIIKNHMVDNNISTEYVNQFFDSKSSIALAFLDEHNNADYVFYKDYPKQRLNIENPDIQKDDMLIFGSFFSLNSAVRYKVVEIVNHALKSNAIIYYDPNFRKTHIGDLPLLKPIIEENFSVSDIVRGSDEDFFHIYEETDIEKIYEKVKEFCPNLICTAGAKGVYLHTSRIKKFYPNPPVETVSTVGAGDNFNAGILYALHKYNISKEELTALSEQQWDSLIQYGIMIATNVCQSYENYISKEFAREINTTEL